MRFLTLIIIAFCFLFATNCAAQSENIPPPKSMQKVSQQKSQRPTFTVGGGLGFQVGTYNDICIMPFAGVYATPWLVALVNGQYEFMWSRNFFNAHVWSLGIALEPIIIKRIVIHAGYEFKQEIFKWLDGSPREIMNLHNGVVGAGYKSYFSKSIYGQALILFNIPLNESKVSNFNFNYYPFFRFVIGIDL